MSAKIKEAEEAIERAEKSLKTSLLKWKPDFDSAANEYQKAATAYKSCKDFEKAVNCCLQAAKCYQQNRQNFSAAKAYEQAGLIAGKDMEKWNDASSFFEKSCQLFREHGVADTAALTYDRGAKMLEPVNPEKAAEFYRKAVETTLLECRTFQAADYASKAVRVYLKLQRLKDALEMLEKQMECMKEADDQRSLSRLTVHLVLVHLARDDYVAASRGFRDNQSCVEEEELNTLSTLLDGVDKGDAEKTISALDHPFIKNLDLEYTKIARDLKLKYKNLRNSAKDSGDEDYEKGAFL
ncbi:gamma-soluble NSF attachment protein-like [Brevipalpus obovatus]|uniref:gamma-soluble NSF attachment protein-like n=1 Tax=Brevipalpus obovatus TaxID=246614 RepID=UPI003D9E38CC